MVLLTGSATSVIARGGSTSISPSDPRLLDGKEFRKDVREIALGTGRGSAGDGDG